METLVYWLARALVALLQALPLRLVARLGRMGGALAWWLDGRHRRVALKNLALCFGDELSSPEIRRLAREHFRRLGENYASAVKVVGMKPEELARHVQFVGAERLAPARPGESPPSVVVAIGHFGNFELYAHFGQFMPAYQCVTTYRALRPPSLDRLFQSLRERTGCLYFERRRDAAALRAAMRRRGVILGLLADQRAVKGGVRVPFFGRECSTSAAPAVFALRYRCRLFTAICYRVDLAQWRIELGAEIPTRINGGARSVREITLDINAAFEAAVRRDPANWFWVHDRWKPPRAGRPGTPAEVESAAMSSAVKSDA